MEGVFEESDGETHRIRVNRSSPKKKRVVELENVFIEEDIEKKKKSKILYTDVETDEEEYLYT